ncbi:hypothetical protein [Parafrankia soli]|uniref:hypothetical protein n=1 Tax=Parafrankia soli TaxID=2599596 RepID=UPI0010421F31|nr:hypothetical protein [Parafrankia soli]
MAARLVEVSVIALRAAIRAAAVNTPGVGVAWGSVAEQPGVEGHRRWCRDEDLSSTGKIDDSSAEEQQAAERQAARGVEKRQLRRGEPQVAGDVGQSDGQDGDRGDQHELDADQHGCRAPNGQPRAASHRSSLWNDRFGI